MGLHDPAGVRVGVVGCGYWGPKHLRVFEAMPTVASIVAIDARTEQLDNVRRALPSALTFATLDEALPHVDALVVATPPSTHFELASQAIAAGKHVLVEKPMTTTTGAAQQLVIRAAEAGTVLMAGHTFEYNPAVVRLRDIVQQELGRIYYVHSARLNLGLYQDDVNVIFDLAPHDVSILNFLLDSEPTSVQAWGSRHAHPRHADVAYVRLDYGERGVCSNIHVSWLDPCKVRRVTVVGSKKMAVYDDLSNDERIRVYDKGVSPASLGDVTTQPPMSYRYGDIVAPYTSSDEPLGVQDAHFVDCVLNGTTPRSDGVVGMRVVRVLEAAQQSLDEGRTVHLDHPDAGTAFAGKQMDPRRIAGLGNGGTRVGLTVLDREPVGTHRAGQ
jgi:predicted dehydrogenase